MPPVNPGAALRVLTHLTGYRITASEVPFHDDARSNVAQEVFRGLAPDAGGWRNRLAKRWQVGDNRVVGRLDQALVERGLCESREQAKRAVLAGKVKINQQLARKPSDVVRPADELELAAAEKFVSRGGIKLEHALEFFQVEVVGQTAIDLGASTGGFTDCLLQRGAAKVWAVDVGQGQFAWKLRRDTRVVVMEKTNARELTAAKFPAPFAPADLAVIDCSFISLKKILPPAIALLRPSGRIIALIKPQFEAGKGEADKGAGVIRDPAIHERVLRELREFVEGLGGWRWRGVTESPILGPAGNKEFLMLLENSGG